MDNLGKQRMGKLLMELIWWALTFLIAWMVTQSLWANFERQNFVYELIFFIIIFITYTRYLFLLKYTFLARFQAMKFLLIFVSLPLTFYLIQLFFNYQDFLEKQNEGMVEFQSYFKEGISFDEHYNTLHHLTKVYNFFGLSAIIVVLVSPFRLLVSYWRVYNKVGTV